MLIQLRLPKKPYNMKKFILFTLLFAGIWGCCGDVKDNWNIDSMNILVFSQDDVAPSNNMLTADSIQLLIGLNASFVSNDAFNFENPFMATAYATSCESDGHLGMDDKISAITVTSNKDFGSIAAGESLNDLISFNRTETMMDWATDIRNKSFEFNQETIFVIGQKPFDTEERTFIVTMEFVSGRTVSGETASFVWN